MNTDNPKTQLSLGTIVRLPEAQPGTALRPFTAGVITAADTAHATVRLETGRQVRYEIDQLLGRRL